MTRLHRNMISTASEEKADSGMLPASPLMSDIDLQEMAPPPVSRQSRRSLALSTNPSKVSNSRETSSMDVDVGSPSDRLTLNPDFAGDVSSSSQNDATQCRSEAIHLASDDTATMLTAGGWDSRLLETLSFCKSISSPGSAAEQIGSVGPGAAGTSMPRVEYRYKLETAFAPRRYCAVELDSQAQYYLTYGIDSVTTAGRIFNACAWFRLITDAVGYPVDHMNQYPSSRLILSFGTGRFCEPYEHEEIMAFSQNTFTLKNEIPIHYPQHEFGTSGNPDNSKYNRNQEA
ncbi:hypothetical protein B0H14DRAFT_2599879 [Mycena olivaceomarginata]|nr:hypothetical protein B0H14DRAFT_2599879 [Mycena olivaceomarginata]